MKRTATFGALLMLFSYQAQAQIAPGGPPVAFAPVTAVPLPLQSTSGRFSSLNPTNRRSCPNKRVTGRVVSPTLIMVSDRFCGRGISGNVMVNIEFGNPADAVQMVVGRRVVITAAFKSAEESRTAEFYAEYLIAEKARLVDADPPAPPVPAFTSYMICQPPELDALAGKLGSELCVQNTIVANLAATGPALEAAARAPADMPAGQTVPGDAIACVADLEHSDMHLRAIACARGSYWAWYQTKWRDYLFSTAAPP